MFLREADLDGVENCRSCGCFNVIVFVVGGASVEAHVFLVLSGCDVIAGVEAGAGFQDGSQVFLLRVALA